MSRQETIKGVLKPTNETLNEYMANIEFPDYYDRNDEDDVEEYFNDKFYRKAVLIDGMVYEVDSKEVEGADIFDARKVENGEIHFLVSYYNGGCSFSEAIDEALEKNGIVK